MKVRLFALLLPWALLLSGCGQVPGETAAPAGTVSPTAETTPPADDLPGPEVWEMTCRIVDGAETGKLLLAEVENGPYDGTGVYSFAVGSTPVWIDGAEATAADLADGMLVTVCWNGIVAESYPAQLGATYSLRAEREDTDDRCGLWLQVLEDLWAVDDGLNGGITQVGVDLSQVPGLTDGERSAIAWAFATAHNVSSVTGTLEELWEEGYFTPTTEPVSGPDSLALYWWEDGVHFSIDVDEEAVWNLPSLGPGEEPPELVAFDAQKRRSGLGAYFFGDCVGRRGRRLDLHRGRRADRLRQIGSQRRRNRFRRRCFHIPSRATPRERPHPPLTIFPP